jgi:ribonuclease HI
MIKLSKETISLFTDSEIQAQYIQSRMIELKSMIRKTCKRTGLTIAQVSEIVSWKKSKTYLTHLTSYKRFREKGDLHLSDLDNLAKKMVAIPTKQ